MINIPMNPAQFEAAARYLNPAETKDTSITWYSATSGRLTTAQITADFNYDPNKDILTLTNEKRHGAAWLASNSTIVEHIEELINSIPAPAQPEPEPETPAV